MTDTEAVRDLTRERIAQCAAHLPAEDPYQSVQAATRAHRVSHGCSAYTFAQGALLLGLARTFRPRRVLEPGTALGYSACCWTDAGASVDTIDRDPVHVPAARENVAAVQPAGHVRTHEGDFERVRPGLPGSYDAMFFDGYEPTAPLLSALVKRMTRPGLLVVPNLDLARSGVRHTLDRLPGSVPVALTPDTTLVAMV